MSPCEYNKKYILTPFTENQMFVGAFSNGRLYVWRKLSLSQVCRLFYEVFIQYGIPFIAKEKYPKAIVVPDIQFKLLALFVVLKKLADENQKLRKDIQELIKEDKLTNNALKICLKEMEELETFLTKRDLSA